MAETKHFKFRRPEDVREYMESKAIAWNTDETKALIKMVRDHKELAVQFEVMKRKNRQLVRYIEEFNRAAQSISTGLTGLQSISLRADEINKLIQDNTGPAPTNQPATQNDLLSNDKV